MEQRKTVMEGGREDHPAAQEDAPAPPPGHRADAERLVLETIRKHADSILRLARRHSLCADDAQDAYQRGLEIFIRRAPTLEVEHVSAWLHQVVKHEAMAVRADRLRLLGGGGGADLDAHEARHLPSPDEQLLAFDRLARSAEAFQRLKPQEVRALWLKAQGHSYQQIAEMCSWTYTKVNRCLTEGRRTFFERYAGIESGAECERWAPMLSAIVDGEATPAQQLEARPHLRNCPACRATLAELQRNAAPFTALLPPVGLLAGAAAAVKPSAGDHGGFVVRLYELVAGGVHERATLSAAKFQAALEAASAGKVAAVAASAAALASGGVAVDRALEPPPKPRAAAQNVSSSSSTPPANAATAPIGEGSASAPSGSDGAAGPGDDPLGQGGSRMSEFAFDAPVEGEAAAAADLAMGSDHPPGGSSFERSGASSRLGASSFETSGASSRPGGSSFETSGASSRPGGSSSIARAASDRPGGSDFEAGSTSAQSSDSSFEGGGSVSPPSGSSSEGAAGGQAPAGSSMAVNQEFVP